MSATTKTIAQLAAGIATAVLVRFDDFTDIIGDKRGPKFAIDMDLVDVMQSKLHDGSSPADALAVLCQQMQAMTEALQGALIDMRRAEIAS